MTRKTPAEEEDFESEFGHEEPYVPPGNAGADSDLDLTPVTPDPEPLLASADEANQGKVLPQHSISLEIPISSPFVESFRERFLLTNKKSRLSQ